MSKMNFYLFSISRVWIWNYHAGWISHGPIYWRWWCHRLFWTNVYSTTDSPYHSCLFWNSLYDKKPQGTCSFFITFNKFYSSIRNIRDAWTMHGVRALLRRIRGQRVWILPEIVVIWAYLPYSGQEQLNNTRKHSSRMRTTRLPTVRTSVATRRQYHLGGCTPDITSKVQQTALIPHGYH